MPQFQKSVKYIILRPINDATYVPGATRAALDDVLGGVGPAAADAFWSPQIRTVGNGMWAVAGAAILMMVLDMGERREIPEILKLVGADIAVWIITFALTVLADLTVAVEVGIILAALVYIRKVTAAVG